MTTSSTSPRNQKSRKVKAILAGGLVLGVGTAVTLAAWTDTEWATGTFTAGQFNIQGSVDGTNYTENTTEGEAATLAFTLPGAENLSPSDVVAAPFSLRTSNVSTYAANVALTSATATGDNAPNLSYGIVAVDDVASCTPEATGTVIVPAGTSMDSIAAANPFALETGVDGEAGAAVTLCFQVTADANLVQQGEVTASWEFTGTSVE